MSAFLLFFCLLGSNAVQYVVIHDQLVTQEKDMIRKSMNELQAYFQEKRLTFTEEQMQGSMAFMESMNQPNQMIRILDGQGKPLLTVSDHMKADWLRPESRSRTELTSQWHDSDHFLVMRSPLVLDQFTGTIEIIDNMENFDKLKDAILAAFIIGGLGAIIISSLGGVYLVRQLLRPIQSVVGTIRRIMDHGFHQRVQVSSSRDELSELAVMFNEMMDQVEASFRRQQQFVEDASHELRTPIAILEGHLSLLDRWGKKEPEVLDSSLRVSLHELSRLKGLVQELLELTKAGGDADEASAAAAYQPEPTIRELMDSFSCMHPAFTFVQELDGLEDVSIRMPPQRLEQILLILLDNAVKYSQQEKQIRLYGKVEAQGLVLEVHDRGIGIPEEDLPHVCERFYRVDKARSRELGGIGLGLSIAKRIVERWGGRMAISSQVNAGTQVQVWLPAEPAARPPEAPPLELSD